MMRIGTAAAALLALAACGGADEGNGTAAAAGGEKAGAAAAGGGDVQLEPGLWEMKAEVVNVQGLPKEITDGMKTAAGQTQQNCITPEEVKQANAGLVTDANQKDCKQEGFAFRNGRIQGKLVCTGSDTPGSATLELNGTYSARTLDMTQKMTTGGEGMNMVMETRVTGRRVGECPAGAEGKAE